MIKYRPLIHPQCKHARCVLLCLVLLLFTVTVKCEDEEILDVEDEQVFFETDPRTWIVYGNAFRSAYLRGHAEIFIQPTYSDGENMTAHSFANLISIRIEPVPSEPRMQQLSSGAVRLSFIWRQVGKTEIIITVAKRPVASSRYTVFVAEEYSIEVPGNPILQPLNFPHKASGSVKDNKASIASIDVNSSCAYATVLTNDAFCTGAMVLHHSLVKTNTTLPVIVLVTEAVSPSCRLLLQHSGMELHHVRTIPNPNAGHKAHFADVYTKLHVFGLEGFRAVVYLDSDFLVLRNLDHLCEYPALSASPEINPPALLNSGLMVLHPSRDLFARLLRRAALLPSYDKTDQGFLNEEFVGRWHMLPYTYNFLKDRGALPDRFDGFVKRDLDKVFAVHMVGEKPWHCRSDHECNVAGRLSPRLWALWLEHFTDMCRRRQRPLQCTKRSS